MSLIKVHRIKNSLFDSCTYVLNVGTGGYWIVDCGDIAPLLHLLENKQLEGIFLTHAHFDHIYGLNGLSTLHPEAKVYTNAYGVEALMDAKKNISFYHETPFVFDCPERIRLVGESDIIELADGVYARVIASPGHHTSCLTYIINDCIFTGDSYIPGIKVVTNLPKGNKKVAAESVERILELAEGKTIYPGHYIS